MGNNTAASFEIARSGLGSADFIFVRFSIVGCARTRSLFSGSSGLRVWCLLPVPDVPYNDDLKGFPDT